MAEARQAIAILAHVSGGIDAGDHRRRYGDKNIDKYSALKDIVKQALNYRITTNDGRAARLGEYFDQVIFSPYDRP